MWNMRKKKNFFLFSHIAYLQKFSYWTLWYFRVIYRSQRKFFVYYVIPVIKWQVEPVLILTWRILFLWSFFHSCWQKHVGKNTSAMNTRYFFFYFMYFIYSMYSYCVVTSVKWLQLPSVTWDWFFNQDKLM